MCNNNLSNKNKNNLCKNEKKVIQYENIILKNILPISN